MKTIVPPGRDTVVRSAPVDSGVRVLVSSRAGTAVISGAGRGVLAVAAARADATACALSTSPHPASSSPNPSTATTHPPERQSPILRKFILAM